MMADSAKQLRNTDEEEEEEEEEDEDADDETSKKTGKIKDDKSDDEVDENIGKLRTDEDGTVYDWDPKLKAWFPQIDDDFIVKYQMNYGFDNTEATTSESNTDQQGSQAQYSPEEYEKYCRDYYNYYGTHYPGYDMSNQIMSDENRTSEGVTDQSLEGGISVSVDTGTENNASSEQPSSEEYAKYWNDYYAYYYGQDYSNYYSESSSGVTADNKGTGDVDGKAVSVGQSPGETKDGTGAASGDAKQVRDDTSKNKKKATKRPVWFEMDDTKSTSVYVTGLPTDITDDEFRELMTKCGLIMFDARTKKPKMKLYKDDQGKAKGDGTCCYIKLESVELSLQILDGYVYRDHELIVEKAKYEMKGSYDPSKKKKKLSNKEKKKFIEKQERLFDWRPDKPRNARMKFEKVVVLKNMFDPDQFKENPLSLNDLRDGVRNQCSNFGQVKKIQVYDCHADGVMTVAFTEAEEADECVAGMNHRYYGTRRIIAQAWDGKMKYDVDETEADEAERLQKWGKFLDGKVGKGDSKDKGDESKDKKDEDKNENDGKKDEKNKDKDDKDDEKDEGNNEKVNKSQVTVQAAGEIDNIRHSVSPSDTDTATGMIVDSEPQSDCLASDSKPESVSSSADVVSNGMEAKVDESDSLEDTAKRKTDEDST